MALAVVQSASGFFVNTASGVTMGAAPTNGNLLIALTANYNSPSASTGWTKYQGVDGFSFNGGYIWYKYAGAGESTTQTPVTDTGRDQAIGIFEISGVTGTWATDVQDFKINATHFAGSAVVTNEAYTLTADGLVLFMTAGVYNTGTTGDHHPTTDGTDDTSITGDGGDRHDWPTTWAHNAVSSGGSGQNTATFPEQPTGSFAVTVQLILNGAGAAPPVESDPGAGSLTITGFAPTATLGPVTSNPGVGTLTLTGFAPTASAGPVVSHPGFQALALTMFAPSTIATTHPGFEALTLTGFAPFASVPSVSRHSQAGLIVTVVHNGDHHTSQMGAGLIGEVTTTIRTSAFGGTALAVSDDKIRTTGMGLLVIGKGATPAPQPQPLGLLASARSKVINQRQVNMFYEPTPDGPTPDARFSRGGLSLLTQRGGGPVYTIFRWQGFQFTVSGNSVFRDNVNIGLVQAGDDVRFATSDNEIVIVTGGQAYYVTETDVTPMTDTDIPDPVIDVILAPNGRFIYLSDKSRWYWSDVGDARNVDPLSFATADQAPDNLLAAINIQDSFVLFGTDSAEWWYATGDDDAPFDRSQGRKYDKGLASRDTLINADNSAYFLGSDRIVYRVAQEPTRVSSYDVENQIRKVAQADLVKAWAFSVVLGGHTFYVLSLPDNQGTWAFDISQGRWSEWKSYSFDNFRVRSADGPYLGDQYTGSIMELDAGTFQDLGDPLERIVSAFLPIRSGNAKNFNLMLSTLRGVGSSACPNPVVEMRFSDSDGRLWTNWMEAPLGAEGDYGESAKAIWDQLGTMTSPGRLFEFRMSDNAEFTPYQAKFNEVRP